MSRRRREARWRLTADRLNRLPRRRALAALVLVAALLLAGLGWRWRLPDPQQALARGLAALAEGRYGAAQADLVAALPGQPGPAQVALARLAIERGDGGAADIALQRAAAAGIAVSRLHALRAAARLLDGDTDAARAEAASAPPDDARFAGRVTARVLAQDGDVVGGLARLAAIVARSPQDAGAWSDMAALRLTIGDMAGASDALRRSLALDGGAPAALTLQARLVRLRYGPVASLPWFAAALRRDPAFGPALIEQAATLGDVGRAGEALAAARAALAARPGSPQPLYQMAVIAARAGRTALARRLLQKADVDGMPGALLLGGWLDQAEGHADLAIDRWQRLLDAQPRNAVVRRLLAAALLRTSDAQGALDVAAPLTARADADAYTLEVAARAARAIGRPDLAATLHDRAIGDRRGGAGVFAPEEELGTLAADAAENGGPDTAIALVRGQVAGGDGTGALAGAQALVRGAPGVAAARLVLGDVLMLAGRGGDAAQVYAAAANLSFDEPTMLRLVDALARAGRPRDAAAAVALYLAQNPASVTARRIAAHWQAVAGGKPAAIPAALGGEAAGLADLALLRSNAGDGAGALRLVRAAYRLTPMRQDVVQAYAAILDRVGDRAGAGQLRAKAAALARVAG